MSYFVIGIGGSGAKLMQTLIHLSAAGLLPDPGRSLEGLMVDPDDANGNVDECDQLARSYAACSRLRTGGSDLFTRRVNVKGPWTPIQRETVDTLDQIFHHTQQQDRDPVEADMLELLFTPEERGTPIHQGFRGRPAIGSAVLNNAIDFNDQNDVWHRLIENAKGAGAFESGVPLLLAGSVFGGSGASGVPTILQVLREPLRDTVNRIRLGLVLFLPYFTFQVVNDGLVQADPHAFPLATAEALKYYDERGFSAMCDTIFAVGEQFPAEMAVSSAGSAKQRNEPHFVELIAGLGAVRFFSGFDADNDKNLALIAARKDKDTLTWKDLPTGTGTHDIQVRKLQQMIQFAVAFHLSFFPRLREELNKGRTKMPVLHQCITVENVGREEAQRDLAAVEDYVQRFLKWLLHVSTPRGVGFRPGLVNVHVFAQEAGDGRWELRSAFRKEKDFRELFLNSPGQKQPDLDGVWKRANDMRVTDVNARGTGRLVRALYDSCTF